jgi:flagellar hook-basal body complex protein FliE
MNEIDVNRLLVQMESMKAAARGPSTPVANNEAADFGALMKASLDKVNEAQQEASGLAQSFEAGDKQADLTQVMISLQKANISFQAMVQVRNKLVAAYQEIMSMQV